ncbi:MAG: 50S ribosomal protein L32 [Vallitaleaceae bacterium]|nr:50S ribosomal protein L32 [Vallitaleaceae bacterium]
MAVPKRKVSSARRDKRRATNFKLTAPNLATCSKCGELVMPHRACRACGTYNKKVVVDAE